RSKFKHINTTNPDPDSLLNLNCVKANDSHNTINLGGEAVGEAAVLWSEMTQRWAKQRHCGRR
ncbi:hypothetical protein A2U01_0101990, partial [Trifolium medium]|nr:hypothetical protein [Trifolium medium]